MALDESLFRGRQIKVRDYHLSFCHHQTNMQDNLGLQLCKASDSDSLPDYQVSALIE